MRKFSAIALLFVFSAANADWNEQPVGRLQSKSATAMATVREKVPATHKYFDDAYGYVVFPGITRAAVGFGGAHGKGVVVEQGQVIGRASYWQFSSGIQAGAKYFTMIIFFKNKEDLDRFTAGTTELMGQAGITLVAGSIDGTPAYDDGVAVFAKSRAGLMAEFSISGAKFNFRRQPGTEEAQE